MVFKLNKKEKDKAEEFMKKHKSCRCNGEYFSYIFTPTGIGYSIEIRCNSCNEVLDITDYSAW